MNLHASVELEFAGKVRWFRLSLGGLEELEQNCDCSIFDIVDRLHKDVRRATTRQILEVIRVGLIGGGLAPTDARALTLKHVDTQSLDESRDVAYAIGLAALARVKGDALTDEATSDNAKKKPKD